MENSLSLPVFSKEEVNAKRQFEYDVAKAFAIVFMILVHTVDQITAGEGSLYCAIEFFGCAPSACVFMISMGLGIVFTRHRSPRDFLLRGAKLLIAAYLLNFFRETLLLILGNALNVENDYQGVSLFRVPHGRRHPPFRRALLPVRGFVREAEAEELGGPADRHRLQRDKQSVPGRVRRALRIRTIPVGAAVLREQRDLLPVLRLVHLPRDRHVPGVAIEARERQEQVLRLHVRARRFVSVPGFFRVRRHQHRHRRIVHDDEVLHAGPRHPDVVPKPRLHAAASVLLALAGRQREGEGRG
jgi:hypothetical protein